MDSPQAQRFLRYQQRQADIGRHYAQLHELQRQRLIEAIDTATGDLDGWWRIVELLAEPDDSHHAAAVRAELTERPGWALLDQPRQQQVLDLGVRYVQGRRALLAAGHGIHQGRPLRGGPRLGRGLPARHPHPPPTGRPAITAP